VLQLLVLMDDWTNIENDGPIDSIYTDLEQESRALSCKEPRCDVGVGLPTQNEYRVIQIQY